MESRRPEFGHAPQAEKSPIPRRIWGRGLIPQQRTSPENDSKKEKKREDYTLESIFNLMEVAEKAHRYLDTPGSQAPNFGRQGWETERQLVISNLMESTRIISEYFARSKGLCLYFIEEDGESLRGKTTGATNFAFGRWEIEIDSQDNQTTVYKTAQELREGYIAAQLEAENLNPPENL